MSEQLNPIAGAAILRNTYYQPAKLVGAQEWMRAKLASADLTAWERGHLSDEIAKIDRALEVVPPFVDVGTISEYGLTQKLSQAIRCFCSNARFGWHPCSPGRFFCFGCSRAGETRICPMTEKETLDALRAEYTPGLLRSTAARMQMRVDAILERDGDRRVAIEGRGAGISFLFAKDIVHALEAGHDEIERLRGELKIALATTVRTAEMLDKAIATLRNRHREPCPESLAVLCDDCPPVGHPTDKTRCDECPRR